MKKLIILTFMFLYYQAQATTILKRKALPAIDTVKSLEIGDQVPDLSFSNVTHTDKQSIRLSDFKGRLLILDFWATWCAPCLHAMPENDKLQKQFNGKIQILCVSGEDKQTVDAYFANTKKRSGMDMILPSLYNEQSLGKYFPHISIPHCVWIDASGKVVAITHSEEVNAVNIQKILDKDRIAIPEKDDRSPINADEPFFNERISKPLFVHEGAYGSQQLKYRSVLTGYIKNAGGATIFYTGRIVAEFGSILSLLGSAYSYSFGNKLEAFYTNRMIVEMSDSARYLGPKDKQQRREWFKTNTYVYDLVFPDYYKGPVLAEGPDSIRKYACEVMKQDIEGFSGLHSRIEKRTVPCLVLKCTDAAKVDSPEDFGPTSQSPGYTGAVFNFDNMEFLIRSFKHLYQKREPFIDDTHYTGRVNIKIDAMMTDWVAVNTELKKFGLEIVREPRTIDMLIITDHK